MWVSKEYIFKDHSSLKRGSLKIFSSTPFALKREFAKNIYLQGSVVKALNAFKHGFLKNIF